MFCPWTEKRPGKMQNLVGIRNLKRVSFSACRDSIDSRQADDVRGDNASREQMQGQYVFTDSNSHSNFDSAESSCTDPARAFSIAA
jgi:hypothetical protein